MKNYFVTLTGLVFITFVLSGCGIRDFFMSEEALTDRECRRVITALEKQDEEGIKKAFYC